MQLPKRPLGFSGVMITTVGFGSWDAASVKLSASDLDRISSTIAQTGAGTGPKMPQPMAA